jgi:hypothetical protein
VWPDYLLGKLRVFVIARVFPIEAVLAHTDDRDVALHFVDLVGVCAA